MTLATELEGRGYRATTVVLQSGGSKDFPITGFPSAPIFLEASSVISTRSIRSLSQTINDLRPDIILGVNQSATLVSLLAKNSATHQTRVASIFHTTVISSAIGRLKLLVYKECSKRLDALFFVSHLQREYWTRKGLTSKQVFSIPNGIDEHRFTSRLRSNRADLRRSYGIADSDLVLVLTGRFAFEKNHAWLLHAIARLNRQDHPLSKRLRFLFIGEGPLKASLMKLTKELSISDQVIFAGSFPDVSTILFIGDIGLLVSNSIETFSLSALELMACGIPMIMTDIGGAREILGDNQTGYLIDVNDYDALVKCIENLENSELRSQMGIAAKNRVREFFTLSAMGIQYDAAFQKLLDPGENK